MYFPQNYRGYRLIAPSGCLQVNSRTHFNRQFKAVGAQAQREYSDLQKDELRLTSDFIMLRSDARCLRRQFVAIDEQHPKHRPDA
jgi:hypothetical protein